MSDSDSSSLSSAPPTDDEKPLAPIFAKMAKDKKPPAKKKKAPAAPATPPSPPRPKRSPSPPHEETPADNPDVAVRLLVHRRVLTRNCTYAEHQIETVPCHVPISLQPCISTKTIPVRTARHREGRLRDAAISSDRRADVRVACARAKSKEAGRVSLMMQCINQY